MRIALWYTHCMTQIIARIDSDLADRIDELIAAGEVESRSDAVRRGLHALIERTRRRRTADAIVAGYTRQPQQDDDGLWADEATAAMIAAEPW